MSEHVARPTPQISPPASNIGSRTTDADTARKELEYAIKGSNQVLAEATTALALFPDTVSVDRAKVTITKRTFFRVAEIASIRIEDVLNVACSVGPFLATITIIARVMNSDQTSVVGRFWRHDAERFKDIAQGYIIALQRNIDCSALETPELTSMLQKLGTDDHLV
ncbi:MAG TPA: hypothetical protein VLF59_01745 [Candidatus Saccharimonadales bacterium]|nr:hypothetical protein [Candidatus Saccharimonadales bacterium]